MSQYNNIFISRDDFLDYKAKGIPYTGFVIGEGYAFVQYQNYYEDTEGTVMDINDNIPSYQICIPNIVQIQCIDTLYRKRTHVVGMNILRRLSDSRLRN